MEAPRATARGGEARACARAAHHQRRPSVPHRNQVVRSTPPAVAVRIGTWVSESAIQLGTRMRPCAQGLGDLSVRANYGTETHDAPNIASCTFYIALHSFVILRCAGALKDGPSVVGARVRVCFLTRVCPVSSSAGRASMEPTRSKTTTTLQRQRPQRLAACPGIAETDFLGTKPLPRFDPVTTYC
eukprot:9476394-Pyramimonas_sp.AAC.3